MQLCKKSFVLLCQATRGSFASKHGVAKVPKQVAMNFMKRTLARCRKHEDTGKSCFSEPALRDIIYSAPAHGNDPELTSCIGSAPDVQNSQLEPRLSGLPSFFITSFRVKGRCIKYKQGWIGTSDTSLLVTT